MSGCPHLLHATVDRAMHIEVDTEPDAPLPEQLAAVSAAIGALGAVRELLVAAIAQLN